MFSDSQDLHFLQEHACVRVVAAGRSITRLHARLTSLVDTTLDVGIAPGTYFIADGAHQDMVVVDEVYVRLPPGATEDVSLRVACISRPQLRVRCDGERSNR